MPYFVRIGPIDTNRTGVGSRGYHIFRRGRKVVVQWGAIEVRPARRFYWIFRERKIFPHPSTKSASVWLALEIRRRVVREKYLRLPPGQRIQLRPSKPR